jgi:hypothetical protein
MTEGQVKAMFTMLEYLARQVVDIKKRVTIDRSSTAQELRRLRERLHREMAEKIQLKQQLEEFQKFQ